VVKENPRNRLKRGHSGNYLSVHRDLEQGKGIDPQIVIDAVKDAMLVAARKHFHTLEDMVADFNDQTARWRFLASRKWSTTVLDPVKEISLQDARRIDPAVEVDPSALSETDRRVGAHLAQTAKQVILQKVREADVKPSSRNIPAAWASCQLQREAH